MGISVSYTPMDAVLWGATQTGYGQARQQAVENDQRQQQISNQLGMQQAQLAQHQQDSQQRLAYSAWQQQQENAQRQQYAQQQFVRDQFKNQYGFYGDAMHDNAMLEAKGFQYSPDDQKTLDKLDRDMAWVRSDRGVGPEQRAYAEQEYIRQKANIRPRQPPPKTADERLGESWVSKTLADGTVVEGVLGERNGAVDFKQVESPRVKQDQHEAKMALEQHKFESTVATNQQKFDMAAAKAENDRLKWEQTSQQKQVDQEEQRQYKIKDNLSTQYMKHLQDISTLLKEMGDPKNIDNKGNIETLIKQREAVFRRVWGPTAAQVAPDLAKELGYEASPQQAAPGQSFKDSMWQSTDENAILGNEGPMQQAPQTGPVQINSPEERDTLPPGTQYISPDGKIRTKQ